MQGFGACLDGISLELMLLDWDRVTKNEVIAKLVILVLCYDVNRIWILFETR